LKRSLIFTSLLLSSACLAAPDETALGKAEGYPVCALTKGGTGPDRCLVGLFSHFDEVYPARKVARGAEVHALRRAPAEPPIAYWYQGQGQARSLEAFLDRTRTTGLLILQGDTILVERYLYDRTAQHRFQSQSMAKTVVAMLVGIAVSEGLIKSIDDRAERYVAELRGSPYGETSLRHLLTMSSGMKFQEEYSETDDNATLNGKTYRQEGRGGADTVAEFRTRENPPGTKFHYASADTQVLALALRAAVGKPLAEYLSEKIWQPMGAEADATWLIDAGGYEVGYVGLNCTLRDWGRLGLLLANGGAIDGRQIVPADWVRAMTTPDAPHLRVGSASRSSGYGYQTWLIDEKEPYFALLGIRGQAIFVDPKTKLVMVVTAVNNLNDFPARIEQYSLFYGALYSLKPKT